MLACMRALVVVQTSAYGKLTVANLHMANCHMAKWHHIFLFFTIINIHLSYFQIKNQSIPAETITEIIILNLEDTGIKEGDLDPLHKTILSLIEKRASQELNEAQSSFMFSFDIRKIIDMIFGMDEIWRRSKDTFVFNYTTLYLEILLPLRYNKLCFLKG